MKGLITENPAIFVMNAVPGKQQSPLADPKRGKKKKKIPPPWFSIFTLSDRFSRTNLYLTLQCQRKLHKPRIFTFNNPKPNFSYEK